MMADTRQYCTFFLDKYYFGVDVANVQEIIKQQDFTHVPLASEVITGLINLRGQIITALDLRLRLTLPPRPDDTPPMNVIMRIDGEVVSFLVDKIGDVLDVPENLFEEPPETLEGSARELISGAYKLEGRLLLILNCDKTIAMDSAA